MQGNNEAELNELSYIYHLRILLYKERDLYRYKYNYMLDIQRAMAKGDKVPKKYKDKTKMDMRALILEAQSKLCDVKARIMKHTNKHSKRVAKLSASTGYSPVYRYGKITALQKQLSPQPGFTLAMIVLKPEGIKNAHDRFLMDKEVEKMLNE